MIILILLRLIALSKSKYTVGGILEDEITLLTDNKKKFERVEYEDALLKYDIPTNETIFDDLYEQICNILRKKILKNECILINNDLIHKVYINNNNIILETVGKSSVYISNDNINFFQVKKIYEYFAKFKTEIVYIYAPKINNNLMCNERYRKKLIERLNLISKMEEGPEIIFRSIIDDYSSLTKICRKDFDWKKFILQTDDVYTLKVGLTTDNKLYHVFDINYKNLNYELILKRYLSTIYFYWDRVYDFLSNFDLFLICADKQCSISEDLAYDYYEMIKYPPFNTYYVFLIAEDELIFQTRVYSISKHKNAYQISKEIFEECKNLNVTILSTEKYKMELILTTVHALFGTELFKTLIVRILRSKISAVKILFIEFLYILKIIDITDINWFLAYDKTMLSGLEAILMNDYFVNKTLSAILENFLDSNETLFYFKVVMLIYMELKDYMKTECKIKRDFTNLLDLEVSDDLLYLSLILKSIIEDILPIKDNESSILDETRNLVISVCKKIILDCPLPK